MRTIDFKLLVTLDFRLDSPVVALGVVRLHGTPWRDECPASRDDLRRDGDRHGRADRDPADTTLCRMMRAAALLLCALLSSTSVRAQRPKLSSGAAAKAASQDESLGGQLASAELTPP